MSIIGLVVVIALLGVLAWIVYQAPMITPSFKTIIYVILVLVAILITASAFGVLGVLHQPVPKL